MSLRSYKYSSLNLTQTPTPPLTLITRAVLVCNPLRCPLLASVSNISRSLSTLVFPSVSRTLEYTIKSIDTVYGIVLDERLRSSSSSKYRASGIFLRNPFEGLKVDGAEQLIELEIQ